MPARSRLREIAKFACGFEAFHVVAHTYFWVSGTTLTVLGFALTPLTPTWHLVSAIVNAAIAFVLGVYAWVAYTDRPSGYARRS